MMYVSDYAPPFTISNKMLGYVSSISEKIGKISNYNDFESKPQLRKTTESNPFTLHLLLRLTLFRCRRSEM